MSSIGTAELSRNFNQLYQAMLAIRPDRTQRWDPEVFGSLVTTTCSDQRSLVDLLNRAIAAQSSPRETRSILHLQRSSWEQFRSSFHSIEEVVEKNLGRLSLKVDQMVSSLTAYLLFAHAEPILSHNINPWDDYLKCKIPPLAQEEASAAASAASVPATRELLNELNQHIVSRRQSVQELREERFQTLIDRVSRALAAKWEQMEDNPHVESQMGAWERFKTAFRMFKREDPAGIVERANRLFSTLCANMILHHAEQLLEGRESQWDKEKVHALPPLFTQQESSHTVDRTRELFPTLRFDAPLPALPTDDYLLLDLEEIRKLKEEEEQKARAAFASTASEFVPILDNEHDPELAEALQMSLEEQ